MDETVAAGLAQVCAGVDALLTADLTGLSSMQVAGLIEALEVQRCRLDAVDARVLAEADERCVAGEFGRTSTADLVTVRCRVDPRSARQRVARARLVAPRRAVSGEALAPLLPVAADTVVAGEVSGAQVDVIAACMERLDHVPDAVDVCAVAERFLVQAARREDPRALRRTAAWLLTRLDADGVEPSETARERNRSLTRDAGEPGRLMGRLSAECAAVWEAILTPLAAPLPAADGTPDERNAGQREHDALLEAGRLLLRCGQLPDTTGTPTTVLLTLTATDLTNPTGTATTSRGEVVSAAMVRALLDEAELGVVTVAAPGQVLRYDRDRRLASPAQRRALAVRDGGCCFPGCTRPAAWTQAHHVTPWLAGGATNLGNLCLVCTHHHKLVERGEWRSVMINTVPHWLPPPWYDPDQTPVRNHAHHPTLIDFVLPTPGVAG